MPKSKTKGQQQNKYYKPKNKILVANPQVDFMENFFSHCWAQAFTELPGKSSNKLPLRNSKELMVEQHSRGTTLVVRHVNTSCLVLPTTYQGR